MVKIQTVVIRNGPQGAKGDPSLTVGPNTLALGAGQYPAGNGTTVVASTFATDVAATAAVTQLTPSGAGTAIAGSATGPKQVRDFYYLDAAGAVADGGTTDNRTVLLALINAVTAAGGGTILGGYGTYGFTGQITVAQTVALRGMGSGSDGGQATVFLAKDSAAQLAFGGRGSAGAARGGNVGNFAVDGANVATNPFYIGRAVGRGFHNISVYNAAGDGVHIDEAQNLDIIGLESEHNGGHGLVLDYGCGGLCFVRPEINDNGGYAVVIQQSGTSAGVYDRPYDIAFWDGIYERPQATSQAMLYIGAGSEISFHDTLFQSTNAMPHVLIEKAGTATTTRFYFDHCNWQGSNTASTGIEIRGSGIDVYNYNAPPMNLLKYVYKLDSGSTVYLNSREIVTNLGTAYLDPAGTAVRDDAVLMRLTAPLTVWRDATTDKVFRTQLNTDGFSRRWMTADGSESWTTGATGTPHTTMTNASGFLSYSNLVYFANIGIKNIVTPAGTANYTQGVTDGVIAMTPSGATRTVFLLTANAARTGLRVTVKNMASGVNLVVSAQTGQTLDGVLTKTITSQYGWIEALCDGTQWLIIGQGGTIT